MEQYYYCPKCGAEFVDDGQPHPHGILCPACPGSLKGVLQKSVPVVADATQMLQSILGSIEGWPDHGGDIRIMEAVEALMRRAIRLDMKIWNGFLTTCPKCEKAETGDNPKTRMVKACQACGSAGTLEGFMEIHVPMVMMLLKSGKG